MNTKGNQVWKIATNTVGKYLHSTGLHVNCSGCTPLMTDSTLWVLRYKKFLLYHIIPFSAGIVTKWTRLTAYPYFRLHPKHITMHVRDVSVHQHLIKSSLLRRVGERSFEPSFCERIYLTGPQLKSWASTYQWSKWLTTGSTLMFGSQQGQGICSSPSRPYSLWGPDPYHQIITSVSVYLSKCQRRIYTPMYYIHNLALTSTIPVLYDLLKWQQMVAMSFGLIVIAAHLLVNYSYLVTIKLEFDSWKGKEYFFLFATLSRLTPIQCAPMAVSRGQLITHLNWMPRLRMIYLHFPHTPSWSGG